MAVHMHTTSRRGLLGFVAALPIAATVPAAVFAAPSPVMAAIAKHKATEAAFEALPADLEFAEPAKYGEASDALSRDYRAACKAVPTTWAEFTALLALMTADGEFSLDEDYAALMLDHARRLSAREIH